MAAQAVPAPGRRFRRPGAVFFFALLFCACDAPPPTRSGGAVLELGEDTIRLAPGATLHQVMLHADPGGAEMRPETVRARAGDVVRFTAADAQPHAVVFDAGRLAPPLRAFLERTGQLRGPPLISAGAAWVVSLDDAPAGAYPFACLTHGALGLLLVSD